MPIRMKNSPNFALQNSVCLLSAQVLFGQILSQLVLRSRRGKLLRVHHIRDLCLFRSHRRLVSVFVSSALLVDPLLNVLAMPLLTRIADAITNPVGQTVLN